MAALGFNAKQWLRAMEDSPVTIKLQHKPKPSFKLRKGWKNQVYAERALGDERNCLSIDSGVRRESGDSRRAHTAVLRWFARVTPLSSLITSHATMVARKAARGEAFQRYRSHVLKMMQTERESADNQKNYMYLQQQRYR
jgi:hypothetical protein